MYHQMNFITKKRRGLEIPRERTRKRGPEKPEAPGREN